MGDELTILLRVTAALESAGIPYMVTGSMAMAFYAEPRMTRDVDLVLAASEPDADRIVDLFSGEFHLDPDRVRDSIRRSGMFNMIHISTIVKVDCVVRKTSPYRLAEFERRRRVDLAGRTIHVVAPEDLVLSKLDWARDTRSEVQLRDVRNLVSMVQGLDWGYMERWAAVLELSELLAGVRR